MSDQLELIFAVGTRSGWGTDSKAGHPSNLVKCADGFTLSVIAGSGCYCSPRPGGFGADAVPETYAGPYTEVEVGYPSERPEPWDEWSEWAETREEPTETVYGYVPVEAVRALVASHGGVA